MRSQRKNKLKYLCERLEEGRHKYKHDFNLIHNLFTLLGVEYCVIGSSALVEYNFLRATPDVDVLVSNKSKHKLKDIRIDFTRDWFTLPKLRAEKIDIIYEGEIFEPQYGIAFPNPLKVREWKKNAWVVSLYKLIEFKLISGMYGHFRGQDLIDVQNLIKNNSLSRDYFNRSRDDLDKKFQEIWDEVHKGIESIFDTSIYDD